MSHPNTLHCTAHNRRCLTPSYPHTTLIIIWQVMARGSEDWLLRLPNKAEADSWVAALSAAQSACVPPAYY